eukprot:gnl/Dysnectes_brevis/3865_a4996_599.p1 GENE.gnl/Dysnectes_brevis/3865_a4996_599~~gnl/Dysnectes_brevis/3865_a4996_599.p1  ORF type:complete len:907 (-),score=368.69 gnl/Dysnectes_brevis/3865_a4996_599:38-2758(-)
MIHLESIPFLDTIFIASASPQWKPLRAITPSSPYILTPSILEFINSDSSVDYSGVANLCFPVGVSLHKSRHEPIIGAFMIPLPSGAYKYAVTLNIDLSMTSEQSEASPEFSYVPVTLCIISQLPLLTKMKDMMAILATRAINTMHDLSELGHEILSAVEHVKLRPLDQGQSTHRLHAPFKGMEILLPPRRSLPATDSDYTSLLSALSPDDTVTVFSRLLGEETTLLLSDTTWTLTTAALDLVSLLFPFQWCCPLIAVVPVAAAMVLHSPVPVLCGMTHEALRLSGVEIPDDVMVVDLTAGTVKEPVHSRDNLPDRLRHRLTRSIDHFLSPPKEDTQTMMDIQLPHSVPGGAEVERRGSEASSSDLDFLGTTPSKEGFGDISWDDQSSDHSVSPRSRPIPTAPSRLRVDTTSSVDMGAAERDEAVTFAAPAAVTYQTLEVFFSSANEDAAEEFERSLMGMTYSMLECERKLVTSKQNPRTLRYDICASAGPQASDFSQELKGANGVSVARLRLSFLTLFRTVLQYFFQCVKQGEDSLPTEESGADSDGALSTVTIDGVRMPIRELKKAGLDPFSLILGRPATSSDVDMGVMGQLFNFNLFCELQRADCRPLVDQLIQTQMFSQMLHDRAVTPVDIPALDSMSALSVDASPSTIRHSVKTTFDSLTRWFDETPLLDLFDEMMCAKALSRVRDYLQLNTQGSLGSSRVDKGRALPATNAMHAQGVFWKRGNFRRTWKLRLIVLEGNVLRWFNMMTSRTPKAIIEFINSHVDQFLPKEMQSSGMSEAVCRRRLEQQAIVMLSGEGVRERGQMTLVPGFSTVVIPKEDQYPTGFPFVIIAPGRVLFCCASSSAERRRWIKIVKTACAFPFKSMMLIDPSPQLRQEHAKMIERSRMDQAKQLSFHSLMGEDN